MSSYLGEHARLYDLFYADKPYREESAFVAACLRRAGVSGTRLVELACGTGRHALELERLGYEVLATDYSQDMLDVAAARAARAGARTKFRREDMRSLDLAGEAFDAAVCLFDSIGYVQSNAAIRAVLSGVAEHLREGGVFAFEFWHAAAMLKSFEPVRVRRWSMDGEEVLRIAETSLDVGRQLATVSYEIRVSAPDGRTRIVRESQTNRYFLVQEMALMLELCGFEPLAFHNGFSESTRISLDTWHVVAVARKASRAPEA